jgi:uncharacterized SAM-dependent methyltransferase
MTQKPDVLDVRIQNNSKHQPQDNIKGEIIGGLLQPNGYRSLPTLLLYDIHGMRIYDEITNDAPEYYLFEAEKSLLKANADDIVRIMHSRSAGLAAGEVVLELGAG